MSEEIDSFATTMTDLISTLNELSAGSDTITSALKSVQEHSIIVKNTYGDVLTQTSKLRDDMNDLANISEKELQGGAY
jgi:methyl-accepting chemotaxis protein